MSRHHVLEASPETCHWGYLDAALKPVLKVASGDTVTVHCLSGGHPELPGAPYTILPEHKNVIDNIVHKFGPHILTGPIEVAGAEPGDVLEVKIEAIQLRQDWGWNQMWPLKGSLPEDFPQHRLLHLPIDRNAMTTRMPWGTVVPLRPFFGIMAVAPKPVYGTVSSVEPREFGGNMDNKEFVPGTSLLLPVQTKGALFSAGDGHAVQGDGEVNLTALETALTGTFKFALHKKRGMSYPRALTPSHYITMGMDPDLDDAAKMALRDMIRLLGELYDLSPVDAYAYCSLACDLHVTQLVDGNKGVHAMVARAPLEQQKLVAGGDMAGAET
ncbi:MAG: acetamidase/formamidase family protein [Candidatus Eiseniibacteriota bacterium]